MDQEGVYKYLGVDESDGIQHSKMKERIRKEYNRRVRSILRTELNGRNKVEAINSLAVPVVQYSFGIIDWKISELKKIDTKTRKLLNMHKMLHPKADVERLYLPRRDAGRGLIEVETAFKTATIGHDHYLKHKKHDRSKATNSITKNATKFKREITMPEFENREDTSASENAKALKHIFKSRMKSMKDVERQSFAWPVSQDTREATCRHNHHQQMVVKQSERRNRGTICGSSRSGNKHKKLPESNMWSASGEQMQNVLPT